MSFAEHTESPAPSIQPATIPLSGSDVTIGRSRSCSFVLEHASVSRHHAKLTFVGECWTLEDQGSRFGTFVNDTRVTRIVLKVGDLVRFGSAMPYRYDGKCLQVESESQGIALRIENLGLQRSDRWLLRDLSADVVSGCFLGLLGQSGVGKSLLLGCLSGAIEPSEGTIWFDGPQKISESLDYYQSRLGVVTQDDLVFTSLTVQENLEYAARLRLPGASRQTVSEAVQESLHKVGLEVQSGLPVNKLSGGQRKRVSLAIELLKRPRLLLLDEPTSGLDPGTQARLMDVLRSLAQQGITIVCATHTPDTMHYFDEVMVLGRSAESPTCVFQGAPDRLLGHFGVRSMADLFDMLQTGKAAREHQGRESPEGCTEPPRTAPGSTMPTGASRVFEPPAIVPQTRQPGLREAATQIQVSFARTLKGLIRDRLACMLTIVQPLVLAFLVVLTQCNQGRSFYICFFLVVSAIWLGMTLTVRDLVRERRLYVRDRLAGISPAAYLGGKLAFVVTVIGAQSILLLATARWIFIPILMSSRQELVVTDLTEGTSFLTGLIVLALAGCGGALIGMIVSVLSKTERAAIALLPLVLLPQVLISRAGYGDGGRFWTEPSPFGPVSMLPRTLGNSDLGPQQYVLTVVSLPLISRPAGIAIGMCPDRGKHPDITGWDVCAEWLYLLALMMAHVLVLFLLFLRLEKRWSLEGR